MQQMMVHKDLEVVLSTTHFINTLQAYVGIVLEVVIGRSTAMIDLKADILNGLYEWTAILESEYQNQPQIYLTAFMIILAYIWRITNNHFTPLLRNPAMLPPDPAYSQIQEHLVQDAILHLTALLDRVAMKTFILMPIAGRQACQDLQSVAGRSYERDDGGSQTILLSVKKLWAQSRSLKSITK
jgi:hypothetical protein